MVVEKEGEGGMEDRRESDVTLQRKVTRERKKKEGYPMCPSDGWRLDIKESIWLLLSTYARREVCHEE